MPRRSKCVMVGLWKDVRADLQQKSRWDLLANKPVSELIQASTRNSTWPETAVVVSSSAVIYTTHCNYTDPNITIYMAPLSHFLPVAVQFIVYHVAIKPLSSVNLGPIATSTLPSPSGLLSTNQPVWQFSFPKKYITTCWHSLWCGRKQWSGSNLGLWSRGGNIAAPLCHLLGLVNLNAEPVPTKTNRKFQLLWGR